MYSRYYPIHRCVKAEKASHYELVKWNLFEQPSQLAQRIPNKEFFIKKYRLTFKGFMGTGFPTI